MEYAGSKSKSDQPFPLDYFFCLFNKHVKILQERWKLAVDSISLVHWVHGWTIPQDKGIVHQIWSDKNN